VAGVLGEGQLAHSPPARGSGGALQAPPVGSEAKPRPLVILVLFEPPRTRVETIMFGLKTNNLEAYLLSLAGYGTYAHVLTLHNLLNVQKLSICRTVTTYKKQT